MSDNSAANPTDKRALLRRAALEYHEFPGIRKSGL